MTTRYCPDCDKPETKKETTHCRGCGFAFLIDPPKVVWLPTDGGFDLGAEEGTPYYEGFKAIADKAKERVKAEPTPQQKGTQQTEGLTPQEREDRVAALTLFYEMHEGGETPYHGLDCLGLDGVGPDAAPWHNPSYPH